MKIEMMPPARLVPYARNARTHDDWQVAQIAASIAEFGFCNPVLAGADGVIIAGHGRIMAAERLGLSEVPVIMLDHLSPTQRLALLVADNKIADNAGWNEALLSSLLAELRDEAFDLDILGFSDSELDDLLADADLDHDPPPSFGDPDFVPEAPPAPVTETGMVWCLGKHRVICGDSTSRADVERLCGDNPVDACWTDPPYNVNYEGTAGKIANDNMGSTEFRRFLIGAFGAAFAVMRAGAPMYIAHADTEGLNFRAAFRDAGFKLSGCLIWVKPSLVLGRSDYQWRHEPILYGWKPGAAHSWYGGRANTTVPKSDASPIRIMPDGTIQVDVGDQTLVVSGEKLSIEAHDGSIIRADKPSRSADHPTMKPVGLISGMLENSTKRGDVVLDIFGGSGSTLIAAHKLGRIARLVELDAKFCDVIVQRWQTFSGETATLEGDGRSFDEVRKIKCKAA
ncbi:site-specific DNA-methyltransferase [Pseudogemmobacter sp. W21_MBD1_M6]|uniref:site-specific DNA-methyltransferase n=1 Tax=Pseudogemmobacter sp. W21_MBD1_M6 TaxID=3240271 RepID=UPI003F95CFFE